MPGRAEHIGVTSDGSQVVRLLCSVSTGDEGAAEEWIHILPGGPVVIARDERLFQVSDIAAVIAKSELPMLVDWEHDSEKWDGSTRAAGWIKKLEMSDGSERAAGLWGSVKWTARGKADVEDGSYANLSPVLLINGETRAVTQVVSVALTNKPALSMERVGMFRERLSARFGLQTADREETSMSPEKRKALVAAFSLAENASDDEILAAATKAVAVRVLLSEQTTQLTAASTELGSFRTRVGELETQLTAARAEASKATLETQINALFEEHKTKITPAMAAGYRAMFAKNPASFDLFKEFTLPTLVEIGAPAPKSVADPKGQPVQFSDTSAGAEETRALLRKEGWSEERIANAEKHRNETKTARERFDEDK